MELMKGKQMFHRRLLIAGLCLGCGAAQLDTAKVSEVAAAVRAAEEMGANQLPKASLHLKLARDQVEQAKREADDGDEENAALLLERARADADLALQLTKTDQEQQKARAAWQRAAAPAQPVQ